MVLLFHLPNLHDIILIKPKGDTGDMDLLAEATLIETAGSELVESIQTTWATRPLASQVAMTTPTIARRSSVKKAMEQMMSEVGALIEAIMKTIELSDALFSGPQST